jgi:hypothetical protein
MVHVTDPPYDTSGELAPEILASMTGEQKAMLGKLREEALSFGAGLKGKEWPGGGDGDDAGDGSKK